MNFLLLATSVLLFSFNIFFGLQSTGEVVINCKTIKETLIDHSLYDSINGKEVFRPDKAKKIYKIIIANQREYYVSKKLMKKIKKYSQKNNCEGITIVPFRKSNSNTNIIRD